MKNSAKEIWGCRKGRTRWRDGVEFLAFLAVAGVLTALPLETASALCGWTWRRLAPLLPRHARAQDNLAKALPETSAAQRERILGEMWENLGRNFAEFFHMPEILEEKRITLEPYEKCMEIAKGPPFVICLPHMGNWEIASQSLLPYGVPITGTYQALTNPLVDKWLYQRRAPMYPGGLYDKSWATARTLMRKAREGGYLAFIADLRERNGVVTEFFGREAWSNPFPAQIARSVGMPIYVGCVLRKPGVTFEILFERVDPVRTADSTADITAMTQAVQSIFEKYIRAAPEQWMWAHRRWD